jgi:hypothetical protein
MKTHAMFKRAAAAAVLAATIAAPGVVGLTAGNASARPLCDIIGDSLDAQGQAWADADAAGNTREAAYWERAVELTYAQRKKAKRGQ